jgi:hypothetical protein
MRQENPRPAGAGSANPGFYAESGDCHSVREPTPEVNPQNVTKSPWRSRITAGQTVFSEQERQNQRVPVHSPVSPECRFIPVPIWYILPVPLGVALSAYSQTSGEREGGRPPSIGVSRLPRSAELVGRNERSWRSANGSAPWWRASSSCAGRRSRSPVGRSSLP